MKSNRTRCKSGIEGWIGYLRQNWQSIEELAAAERNYGVVSRLGFDSVEQAWELNPTIRVSVIPRDLEVVKTWPTYIVRYWTQDPRINDCYGNSVKWAGKARTESEAIRKAKQFAMSSHVHFRLADVTQKS